MKLQVEYSNLKKISSNDSTNPQKYPFFGQNNNIQKRFGFICIK